MVYPLSNLYRPSSYLRGFSGDRVMALGILLPYMCLIFAAKAAIKRQTALKGALTHCRSLASVATQQHMMAGKEMTTNGDDEHRPTICLTA